MSIRKKDIDGFSLAEVVVALAIVGLALLFFHEVNLENVKRSGEVYRMRVFKTLAREVMEDYLLKRASDDDQTQGYENSGRFERVPGYSWEIDDSKEFEVPYQSEEDRLYGTGDEEEDDDGTQRFVIVIRLKLFRDNPDSGREEIYSLSTLIQEKRDENGEVVR